MLNINQFTFAQMFNNSKGKTSPMLFVAFCGAVVSLCVFSSCAFVMMALVVHESKTDITGILNSILMQSVALFTLSSGMLTVRRFTQDKEINNDGS